MEMVPVTSAAVNAIGYDRKTKTARVEFSNGRVHDFAGVTPEQHKGLVEAESIGRHFNTHFRGRKHVRVT